MTILVDRCGCLTASGECPGRVLVVGESGGIIEGECDRCRASFGIPVLRANPAVKRQRLLAQSGIPERFSGRKFEETPDNAAALRAVKAWLSGFTDGPLPAPALFGEPGRGKTHLMAAVARKVVLEHMAGLMFTSARSLLRDLQDFDGTADQTWRRATSVRVLVLDDLGAQRPTEWRDDQLADLVDERYERELPVLVATNFPPSAWSQMLDARTASRLRAMCFPVELGGVDRRQAQPAMTGGARG